MSETMAASDEVVAAETPAAAADVAVPAAAEVTAPLDAEWPLEEMFDHIRGPILRRMFAALEERIARLEGRQS